MTPKGKLLVGGAAIAAVGLGAAGAIARHGHGWGPHHGGFGMGPGMGPGMGHMGMMCKDGRTAEMVDHMLVRLEYRAKITDAQKPAFEDLKTAARSAAAKVQAACPDTAKAPAEPPKDGTRPSRPTPIERLANAETMTAATLDAIKTVRPAAEKLYVQLSDEQKSALNERPGRKWGRGWNRDGRDHDRGGPDRSNDRGPDPGPPGDEPDATP